MRVAVLVHALEERELGDPDVLVRSLADRRRTQRRADRAEHVTGLGVLVGHAEDEVADLGAVDGRHGRALGLVEELGQRRVEPVGGDPEPRQALGAQ